jgi:hypothetical protein
MKTRVCPRCEGSGTTFWKGFTSLEGKVYADRTEVCNSCMGRKVFEEYSETEIRDMIFSKRGNKRLLAAFPAKFDHYRDHKASRAYFCWRLARFHGGKDSTMPMTAEMVIRNDPFKPELDKLAERIAIEAFGSDMEAAKRWGRAFGLI